MTFFGDLFEVAGGGAGGFAAGMRAQREQQLERDNLRMREAEMEAAAVDRSLMRGIQQQQVQLAEEQFQHQRQVDRRDSLLERMKARDGAVQQKFENDVALAREGFAPSGDPLSYNQLPLTDQALIDQRRASADASALRGMGAAAGRQFGDAERGLAEQILAGQAQQNRDRLDFPAMEQMATELAQQRGMDPAAVRNALSAVTGEYMLDRIQMPPMDRMMENMLPSITPYELNYPAPMSTAPMAAPSGGEGYDPAFQEAIESLAARGITDEDLVIAELRKMGLIE